MRAVAAAPSSSPRPGLPAAAASRLGRRLGDSLAGPRVGVPEPRGRAYGARGHCPAAALRLGCRVCPWTGVRAAAAALPLPLPPLLLPLPTATRARRGPRRTVSNTSRTE